MPTFMFLLLDLLARFFDVFGETFFGSEM